MREPAPVLTHATIPPEVPELPAALQTRQALLDEMKLRVLSQSQTASTTSLVGVSRGAATTSAHGMVYTRALAHPRTHTRTRNNMHACTCMHTQGGVGKTTAAVQLIRDPEVRAAFQKLLWVSVSQEPDILALLRVLYSQLKSSQMPKWVESERDAVQELTEAARGLKVLCVLDDCWEEKHAKLLNCVDADAGAACYHHADSKPGRRRDLLRVALRGGVALAAAYVSGAGPPR